MPICETCFHNKYCEIYDNGYGNKVKSCRAYKSNVQTNEEWMKSVSVSEAIGYFCYKALGSDGCNACRLNTKEKCRLNEWLKEIHE